MLSTLQVSCQSPTILHFDNRTTLHLEANKIFHKRTKHIKVDCYFIRDVYKQYQFKVLIC